jgi:diguanylate cyclase (GGDEF)-like protein/PAS domain S-box-containing protein
MQSISKWTSNCTTQNVWAIVACSVGGAAVVLGSAQWPTAMQPLLIISIVTVSALVMIIIDLLVLQQTHAAQRQHYARLLQDNSDALLKIDTNGKILFASPAVRDLGGFDPHQLVGQQALDLVQPGDIASVQQAHAQALANPGHSYSVEYQVLLPNGVTRWFETRTRAVCNIHGESEGAISSIRDVTERKSLETRLSFEANTDALTGLPNRRAFFSSVRESLANAGPVAGCCALAICDLDYFKSINDRYGHAAGDTVLQAFGLIAKTTLRATDMIGRIGGEEFGILICDATPEEGLAICERLRLAFAATPIMLTDGTYISATCSLGMTRLAPARTVDVAFAQADAALYQAKNLGRNRLQHAA